MKKCVIIALFIIGCSSTNGPEEKVVSSIYGNLGISDVSSIEVLRYDSLYSSHYVIAKTITDSDTINLLLDLLRKMPEEGEIMVSFISSAPYQKVLFKESDVKVDTIEIIANRVKTPATSFYDPARNSETKFVEMVLAQ